VFNEVNQWIDDVRKKAPGQAPIPQTLTLPITEAQFSKTQANLQAMAATMDSSMAQTTAYEIRGLVEQIQIHRRNLTDLESQQTVFGALVPPHVKRGIERESQGIVEKTAQLVQLLKQVYRKQT
jgi:hypothetical protein